MRRGVLSVRAISLALALALIGFATPALAQEPGDTVVGNGGDFAPGWESFEVDAASGAAGEAPHGTFSAATSAGEAYTFSDGTVTCMVVSGNRAIVGGFGTLQLSGTDGDPPPPPQRGVFMLVVEDNGPTPPPDPGATEPQALDRAGVSVSPSESAADCHDGTARPGLSNYTVGNGDVAVTDTPPSALMCGDVITEDTTLERDLDCRRTEAQSALIIGAPGITLNLGGHRILTWNEAVRNEGHDDVTIKNGAISSETGAIALVDASGNVIRDVSASGLYTGFTLDNSDHTRIVSSKLSSVSLSVRNGSDWNTIARNVVTQYEGTVSIVDSAHNRFVDNTLWSADDTPLVLSRAHSNVIARNALVTSYNPVVWFVASNRNRFADNTVVAHGPYRGPGLTLEGSNRNLLVRNTFGGAPLAFWLRSGNANELRDNDAVGTHLDTFDDAEESGFLIAAAAQRTLIVGNSASDFDVNGFSVYGAQSQVGSNDATDNGAWGIDAIPGTTDLGGNTASGNGRPEQCRNVACAPG